MNNAGNLLINIDFMIDDWYLALYLNTLILRWLAISLKKRQSPKRKSTPNLKAHIYNDKIQMFQRITKMLNWGFRTIEQDYFLDKLSTLQFNSEEDIVSNVRFIYERRELLQNSEQVVDFVGRIEASLLKRRKCSVAQLQCYYKLKQMRLITPPFKHNLHRKYYHHLTDQTANIRNEHLEKYLWFLFEQGRYQRQLFEQASSLHTIKLFQVYEYMSGLSQLPTWQPYIRVSAMLQYLGHEIKGHRALQSKAMIDKIQHHYFPYIALLFTAQDMKDIQLRNKYDEPFVTTLCNQYIIKNTSRYDSYLQRVERVELQKSYERILQIMSWPDMLPLLDLVYYNYTLYGVNQEIQNQFSQIFFRLCEHTDIDLQTITGILSKMHQDPQFMYLRKSPIITRTIDAITNRNLQDFSYLPTDAYIQLLQTSKQLKIGNQAIKALQTFLCNKIQDKRIWNDGDQEKLKEAAKEGRFEGGDQLISFLQQKR